MPAMATDFHTVVSTFRDWRKRIAMGPRDWRVGFRTLSCSCVDHRQLGPCVTFSEAVFVLCGMTLCHGFYVSREYMVIKLIMLLFMCFEVTLYFYYWYLIWFWEQMEFYIAVGCGYSLFRRM